MSIQWFDNSPFTRFGGWLSKDSLPPGAKLTQSRSKEVYALIEKAGYRGTKLNLLKLIQGMSGDKNYGPHSYARQDALEKKLGVSRRVLQQHLYDLVDDEVLICGLHQGPNNRNFYAVNFAVIEKSNPGVIAEKLAKRKAEKAKRKQALATGFAALTAASKAVLKFAQKGAKPQQAPAMSAGGEYAATSASRCEPSSASVTLLPTHEGRAYQRNHDAATSAPKKALRALKANGLTSKIERDSSSIVVPIVAGIVDPISAANKTAAAERSVPGTATEENNQTEAPTSIPSASIPSSQLFNADGTANSEAIAAAFLRTIQAGKSEGCGRGRWATANSKSA